MANNILNPNGYVVNAQPQQSNAPAWKYRGGEIVTAIREFQQYGAEMDPYTARKIKQQIADLKAQHMQAIQAGMAGEIREAIKDLEAARNRQAVARSLEVSSWESRRLADEIYAIKARVELAINSPVLGGFGGKTTSDKLEALYQDVAIAGEKHQLRAVAEVFASIQGHDSETRHTLNAISKDAEAKVSALRHTEMIQLANDQEAEAEAWLLTTCKIERDAMLSMGEFDPIGFGTGAVAEALSAAREYVTMREPDSGTTAGE